MILMKIDIRSIDILSCHQLIREDSFENEYDLAKLFGAWIVFLNFIQLHANRLPELEIVWFVTGNCAVQPNGNDIKHQKWKQLISEIF